jgi:hypothetical protein
MISQRGGLYHHPSVYTDKGGRRFPGMWCQVLPCGIVSEPSEHHSLSSLCKPKEWCLAWLLITISFRTQASSSDKFSSVVGILDFVNKIGTIHLLFRPRISLGSCVIPSCTSAWQFAHKSTHLSISFLIASHDLVNPLEESPKSFWLGSIWWKTRARGDLSYPHNAHLPPLYSRAISLRRFRLSDTAFRKYGARSAYVLFSFIIWYTHLSIPYNEEQHKTYVFTADRSTNWATAEWYVMRYLYWVPPKAGRYRGIFFWNCLYTRRSLSYQKRRKWQLYGTLLFILII